MLKELRQLVASAIADVKSYDVPGLCRRPGLADGTGEEAFSYLHHIISAGVASQRVIFAALMGAISWNLVTWWGWPSLEQLAGVRRQGRALLFGKLFLSHDGHCAVASHWLPVGAGSHISGVMDICAQDALRR